ncbi:hypothetical protein RA307_17365 [Xanthobacteraceae bacterium Astr-EGSB]|uniref:hypothetical protein n=1 Tax=Astrobacterium formosum TaxID=3069710 RepID=UPI0027B2DDE3|nr:hypothetical protein [Xanthobacteraceae bacterium Astr-EGSB]
MAQMVSEVYDALRSVNVPEDKARKAAEALAVPDIRRVYDARFDKIDGDIAALKADVAGLKIDVAGLKTDVATLKTDVATLKADFAALKTDVTLMKWMLGFVLAMNAGILARLLFVH